jgi:hypothetical protein
MPSATPPSARFARTTSYVYVYDRILRPMPVRTQECDEPHAMEIAMKCGRTAMMAIPLLIGIGLLLSACVGSRDYDTPVYSYGMPYGSLDLAGWR